jgi:AAA family ATPase
LKAGSSEKSPKWYTRPSGILLHGPKGTGKSLLLSKIAASRWGKVSQIYPSAGSSAVRKLFAEAKKAAGEGRRSIILVDQMEKWASSSGDAGIGDALDDEMRLLSTTLFSRNILVVGATNQLSDLPDYLRGPRTFKIEIDVPTPDVRGRIEILECLKDSEDVASGDLLALIGRKTHGYTGSDLELLLWTANSMAEERVDQERYPISNGVNGSSEPLKTLHAQDEAGHQLTEDDFDRALLKVRPSAMREFSLEVPKVKWSDIGGQEEVKRRLRQAVDWPLKVRV